MATGWWLRGGPPAPAAADFRATTESGDGRDEIRPKALEGPDTRSGVRAAPAHPPANDARAAVGTTGAGNEGTIDALRRRDLRLPIDDVDVERLKGMFAESRDGGGHAHEAVDILAPRNTPVHAVDNGTVEKLFTSKAGGLTIYQFDPDSQFCYYYAHLERYARGLHEGQQIARGEVIGYVGTSGNAPAQTPHLHFAIFELGPDRHWWKGRPIDPYLILRR